MRKKHALGILVLTAAAVLCGRAAFCESRALPVPSRDYFKIEIREEAFPAMRTAREWFLVPDLTRIYGGAGAVPSKATGGHFTSEFTAVANSVITENDLGGGAMLTVKADGEENEFAMLLTPRAMLRLGIMRYDIKTTAPAVDDTRSFRAREFEIRYRDMVSSRRPLQAMGAFSFIDNNVDDMFYLAAAVSSPFKKKWTGSLGIEHATADVLGEETGIIAGVRYSATPKLQGFAVYQGADPRKFLYNNQFLRLIPNVGDVYCTGCDSDTFTVGLSYQPVKNISISITGYDLEDLEIPVASIFYVTRD